MVNAKILWNARSVRIFVKIYKINLTQHPTKHDLCKSFYSIIHMNHQLWKFLRLCRWWKRCKILLKHTANCQQMIRTKWSNCYSQLLCWSITLYLSMILMLPMAQNFSTGMVIIFTSLTSSVMGKLNISFHDRSFLQICYNKFHVHGPTHHPAKCLIHNRLKVVHRCHCQDLRAKDIHGC